jgi:2-phosphoglycerate kinase
MHMPPTFIAQAYIRYTKSQVMLYSNSKGSHKKNLLDQQNYQCNSKKKSNFEDSPLKKM